MDKLAKLLVGVDFSPRSFAACQMAVSLAKPTNTHVELIHVIELKLDDDVIFFGKTKSEIEDILRYEADISLDAYLKQLDYENMSKSIVVGNPADMLTKRAGETDADILLVGDTGSHSTEPAKGVGVNAYRLVEKGPRKVMIVNARYNGRISNIAAAISFVPVADELMKQAVLLARTSETCLHVLHAIPDIAESRFEYAFAQPALQRALSQSRHYKEKRLKEFIDNYKIKDVETIPVVLSGNAGKVLVEYLKNEDIDVVVMGTGTSFRIANYPIGSTTHTVLNRTLSSVYIVRSLESIP